jgi:outer membrane lipoprotein carrier protein
MKRLRFFTFFVLSLLAAASFANSANTLNQMLSKFNSLSANFTQRILGEKGQVLQTSTGKLSILRPGKFYWKTSVPLEQTILTNGKTLWVYEPDLEQVTVKALGTSLDKTPLLILTKRNTDLQKDFTIKVLGDSRYQLTPKTAQSGFKQVTLQFKNGVISELDLINALNRKTLILFNNVKLNPRISDKQFNFKIPKGVDVVKS